MTTKNKVYNNITTTLKDYNLSEIHNSDNSNPKITEREVHGAKSRPSHIKKRDCDELHNEKEYDSPVPHKIKN